MSDYSKIYDNVNQKIAVVVSPVTETTLTNDRKSVSVKPIVTEIQRENNYPIIVVHGVMGSNLLLM